MSLLYRGSWFCYGSILYGGVQVIHVLISVAFVVACIVVGTDAVVTKVLTLVDMDIVLTDVSVSP
jgi:hypothetical protein